MRIPLACAIAFALAAPLSAQDAPMDSASMSEPAEGLPRSDRWRYVADGGPLIVFVDSTTMVGPRTARRVWIHWGRTEPATMPRGARYTHRVTQDEYDCPARRSRTLTSATYNGSAVVASYTTPPAELVWEPVIPESLGEGVMEWVCARAPRAQRR